MIGIRAGVLDYGRVHICYERASPGGPNRDRKKKDTSKTDQRKHRKVYTSTQGGLTFNRYFESTESNQLLQDQRNTVMLC